MLVSYQEKVRITKDNLAQTLEAMNIAALAQAKEIERLLSERGEIVVSHYEFVASPGNQRGELTVFHDLSRGAICLSEAGENRWGDWDETYEILTLDDGEKYYCDGKPVYGGDDGSCSLGNI